MLKALHEKDFNNKYNSYNNQDLGKALYKTAVMDYADLLMSDLYEISEFGFDKYLAYYNNQTKLKECNKLCNFYYSNEPLPLHDKEFKTFMKNFDIDNLLDS